ncbi:MAG: LuxR-family transcriptional regulator, partial [Frankiales bacterium]|nr:LuxR-family transcriptional regulator [Frankiales bacterium]
MGPRAAARGLADDRSGAPGTASDRHVDDPEQRVWHLAATTVTPDRDVADLLDGAAHRSLRNGDAVRAVSALLRAAELSPHARDRARRLAEAAYLGADVTGELRNVPLLLAEARRAHPEDGVSLPAAVATAYHLLNGDGDVDTALRILVSAVDEALRSAGDDDGGLNEALHTLLLVCSFSGRDSPWRPFQAAITRLTARVPLTLALSASTFADPARATTAELERLDSALAASDDQADPSQAVRLGIAAFYVDRLAGVRRPLWRVVHDGRAGGAVASEVSALMMLCHDALQTGEWDDAQRWA